MTFKSASKRQENGYATVVVFALLAIVIMIVMSQSITLTLLRREIRLTEERQIEAEKNNWRHTNTVSRVVIPIDDDDGSRP